MPSDKLPYTLELFLRLGGRGSQNLQTDGTFLNSDFQPLVTWCPAACRDAV